MFVWRYITGYPGSHARDARLILAERSGYTQLQVFWFVYKQKSKYSVMFRWELKTISDLPRYQFRSNNSIRIINHKSKNELRAIGLLSLLDHNYYN